MYQHEPLQKMFIVYITYNIPLIFKQRNIKDSSRLRGVQGQKSWNHYFEITGHPKGPPSGSTFWLCFEVPYPYGHMPRPF